MPIIPIARIDTFSAPGLAISTFSHLIMVNVLSNIFKILSFPVVFLLSFSFLTCFYSSGFLLSARGMSVGGNCPRGLLS